jgi:hypothetical protein
MRKTICQAREKNRQSELVGRLLALRAFDERDHPVDEGGAGRGRDLHSDPVRENSRAACHGRSVAAGLAYDGRRLAGDGGLIDRSTTVDDFAIAGNEIAGFDEHDVANFEVERRDALINVSHARRAGRIDQALGVRVGACPSQRVSLRLAAAFRDGLGKIGEENREPEPGGDLPGEEGRAIAATKIADKKGGDHDGHDLRDEDDGIARELSGIELDDGVARCAFDDARVEQPGSGDFA